MFLEVFGLNVRVTIDTLDTSTSFYPRFSMSDSEECALMPHGRYDDFTCTSGSSEGLSASSSASTLLPRWMGSITLS